jgi:hypothetical protein
MNKVKNEPEEKSRARLVQKRLLLLKMTGKTGTNNPDGSFRSNFINGWLLVALSI